MRLPSLPTVSFGLRMARSCSKGGGTMNDILFGNNNTKTIKRLSKQYFKKNKVRNLAAILAIVLTAFLFTSITSLAFNMVSSMQLSMQMQKGSKGDGTFGYMTEEQFEQLKNSDFVEQAGHRRTIGYASNAVGHSVELNYADSIQQELTFCVPTHGSAPEKANEIATTELALKALGVEPEIGAEVPLEFELRGKTYHYDMVLSGWWEASNDSVSVATVSEQFIKENPDVVQNTYAVDHVMSGVTFSDVVLKNKANVQQQLNEFVYSIGGNPEDMGADNFILASENQMSKGLTSSESIVFAVVFILMFVVCGYLLIYNIFDISVMQDVRQYGLLRTIGTSTRQIKGIVNRQAVWLTLIGLPIGLIAGFFAGWVLLPIVTEIINLEYSMVGTSVSTSPLIFVIAALFTILTVFISTRKPAKKAAKISPLEALGYRPLSGTRRDRKVTRGNVITRISWEQFVKDKKRTAMVLLSLAMSLSVYLCVVTMLDSQAARTIVSNNMDTDLVIQNDTGTKEKTKDRKDIFSSALVKSIQSRKDVTEMLSLIHI